MYKRKMSPYEFTLEELDIELLVRSAKHAADPFLFDEIEAAPALREALRESRQLHEAYAHLEPDPRLSHLDCRELADVVMELCEELGSDAVRGVYGKDGRKDYYQLTDPGIRKNVESVAVICRKSDLIKVEPDMFCLKVKKLMDIIKLCPEESYVEQPVGVGYVAGGFLVAKDIIATAAHVVETIPIEEMCFLFGYRMEKESVAVTRFTNQNIRYGVKLMEKDSVNSVKGKDWALVELDRPLTDRTPVRVHPGPLKAGGEAYVLGYPMGLPIKFCDGARVLAVEDFSFTSNLDIFKSNSGSPVFDKTTHLLVGMVAQGDNSDFRFIDPCYRVVVTNTEKRHRNTDPNRPPSNKPAFPRCVRVQQFMEPLKAIVKSRSAVR